jgi:hypothetical protein
MFKRTTTDFTAQPTTTQQRHVCAVRLSALSHTFVARSKSHLFRRTNSEPHKCVYCSQIYVLMERFTSAEIADIHLAYGSAYGKGREGQRICHERFPNSVCPDYRTFASVDRRLRETGTYAVNGHSKRRGRSFRTPHLVRTFCSVWRRIPPTSTRAVGDVFGADRRLVWNFVREQDLYPFHRQKTGFSRPQRLLRRDKYIALFTRVQRSLTFP